MISLRTRWAAFVGTFIALGLGVALISMTGLVLLSAAPRIPDRLAGTEVFVRAPAPATGADGYAKGRPWSPETVDALVAKLEQVPGVEAAVPDREFYAQVVLDGKPVEGPAEIGSVGYGWSSASLAPYRITGGAAPGKPGELVVPRTLGPRPGDRVELLTATGPAPYTVTGTTDGPALYVSDAEAAKLAGGVRIIGVRASADTAPAVTKAVADQGKVLTGDARDALEPEHEATLRWISEQVLVTTAGLAAFVSVFVVASTFAFGVNQRRREFGLLRAVGATPRQVRRIVYGEAAVVGALAGVSGALLGAAGAPILGDLLDSAGLVRPGFTVQTQFWPLAASAAVGFVVALVGVWSASRRAGRIRPMEALREAAVEKRPMTIGRWVSGLVLVAGGLALVAATAASKANSALNYAMLSAMVLIVALTLLAPVVVPPIVRIVCWPFARMRGATGMLVREGSLVAVRRVASTAAPVLVTVGFAVLITGSVATMAAAGRDEQGSVVGADTVIAAEGAPGLSDAVVRAAGDRTLSTLDTFVYAKGDHYIYAVGTDPALLGQRLKAVSGDLADARQPDTLVVAEHTAGDQGWRAGATVPVTFEDGRTVSLRVAAVVEDDTAPASIFFDRALVRAHDPSALTELIFTSGTPQSLAGLGAVAMDIDSYVEGIHTEEGRLVQLFVYILIGTSLGYTGIAIANTLLMATSDRVRDFTLLRLSGATVRQVMRLVTAEAVIVVAVGTVLGGAVAVAALMGITSSLEEAVGTSVDLVLPWSTILTVVGTCLALAVVASAVPARLALRSAAAATAGERT